MFLPYRLRRCALAGLWLIGVSIATADVLGEIGRPSPGQLALAQREVDKLLVVDCLLPGQVRRLGAQLTYLSARRPAKLSADECGLRGGEYVMYDRADLGTALSSWLPLANKGDPEAQTYVGELYERGVGGEAPRYADAAQWYRKAADQGYARGMINLGFLYEKGLGVTRDPAAALAWYRKAAGLGDAIALEGGDRAATEAEIRKLRRELEDTRRQLEDARNQLDKAKNDSHGELRMLEERIRQARQSGDHDAAARLGEQLRDREAELDRRSRQVAELSSTAEGFRRQLAALEAETASLRDQLRQARAQLNDSQAELAVRQANLQEAERRLQTMQVQLARQKDAAGNADAEATRRLEAELRLSEQELIRQRQEIDRVEREAADYKSRLQTLEARTDQAAQPAAAPVAVAIAPPSIQLIDPPVMTTRGPILVKIRGTPKARELVGKVTAPAGLLSFTVNDATQQVDGQGLFKTAVPLRTTSTPVSLVAVDRNGKRAELEFSLVPEGVEVAPTAPPAAPPIPDIQFGRYHALVVGNQDYRQLPKLDTAIEDARAVGDLLARKYGFKVTRLTNASRYELLSALNKLRAELTEHDNLVIYYAGHGEIDRANQRGHWLPIDAEPDSDANWISNVSITDILNAMSVKHVLVIADSCYSGTLTRSSIGQLDVGVSPEARTKWLKAIVQSRTRTVLTSGGVQPVLDGGGGKHSVFAKSLLEVLTENQETLEAQRLYREVAARVLDRASRFQMDQRPEYAPLKYAGHESGDFLFVPSMLVAGR